MTVEKKEIWLDLLKKENEYISELSGLLDEFGNLIERWMKFSAIAQERLEREFKDDS